MASQYSEASARIGSVNGMVTLSLAAEDRGDIDEALHWAKRASAAGNDRAFFHVYWLLANHERFDEAEAWIRPLADQGDITAIRFLAAQLAETGRITEAEELLWPAARDNLRRCRRDLIDLLYKAGRRDRISALFGQLADSGDDDAQEWLSAVARWDENQTERETDRPGDRPDPQEMAAMVPRTYSDSDFRPWTVLPNLRRPGTSTRPSIYSRPHYRYSTGHYSRNSAHC